MADSYTKLFSDIVDSSIWSENAETCKVWITLIALCNNSDGYVRGSSGWLAGKAKVSKEACDTALDKFSSPDPHSRTPDNEGRRIEVLEDGWLILNYLFFRERLSSNPKTIKTRERVRKHRERFSALRNAESVTVRYPASASVSVPASKEDRGVGKGERQFPEIEVPSWQEVQVECAKIGLVEWRARDWFNEMERSGWIDGQKREVKKWRAFLATIKVYWERDGRPMTPPKGKTTNLKAEKHPNIL